MKKNVISCKSKMGEHVCKDHKVKKERRSYSPSSENMGSFESDIKRKILGRLAINLKSEACPAVGHKGYIPLMN